MKKRRLYTVFAVCLSAFISFAGCSSSENTADEETKSVVFQDYAPRLSGDGKVQMYIHEGATWFPEKAEDEVEADFFAVYDNKLYYVDAQVGFETGTVSGENCRLLCRDLDNPDEESRTVLEWNQIAAIGDLMIQEGVLYASWLTTEDEIKRVVMDLESGSKTEVRIPEGRKPETFTAEEYYYADGKKIYRCGFEEEAGKLFCETEGDICAVYKAGENLCAITESGGEIFLEQFGAEGERKERCSGLEQAGTGWVGKNPRFVKAESDILFYELNGKADESDNNTFLIQMNVSTQEKEILGGWYMP